MAWPPDIAARVGEGRNGHWRVEDRRRELTGPDQGMVHYAATFDDTDANRKADPLHQGGQSLEQEIPGLPSVMGILRTEGRSASRSCPRRSASGRTRRSANRPTLSWPVQPSVRPRSRKVPSRFAPKRPAVTMNAHEEAETTLLSNLA